eukprot:symbB.v1.2.021979.t1/scaffold1899.1/size238565/15
MAPTRSYSGVSLSPPPLHHLRHVPSHLALSGLSPRQVMTPKGPATPTSPGIHGFQQIPTRYSFGQSLAVPVAWSSPRTPRHTAPARQSFTVPVKVRAAVRNLSTSSTTSTVSTPNSLQERAPSREPRYKEKEREKMEKMEKEESVVIDDEMRALCRAIDSDKDGYISRWDFFSAVQSKEEVAKTLLPKRDASLTMKCPDTFDEVERIFRHMAGSKGRIAYSEFAMYWQSMVQAPKERLASDLQDIFKIIDVGGTGEISRLALLSAVENSPLVAVRLLPGVNTEDPEQTFTATEDLFDTISHGKRRVTFLDFEEHFKKRRPSLTMSRSKAAVQPGNGLLWRSHLY